MGIKTESSAAEYKGKCKDLAKELEESLGEVQDFTFKCHES